MTIKTIWDILEERIESRTSERISERILAAGTWMWAEAQARDALAANCLALGVA